MPPIMPWPAQLADNALFADHDDNALSSVVVLTLACNWAVSNGRCERQGLASVRRSLAGAFISRPRSSCTP
ncbi:hypothetical protein SCP_1201120 [Sparassis crispa]|uniref:Uncharacterized protein n=1 Tax=Sparassis crispa TaxID=139825 RepID=A0A401H0C9_9APHY|nr:hypothetical protein SCP_1201120 [Sparassis crispa]GBE87887.1 hypothetical protein SCP_1201120 [Sparassis crispa]